MREPASATAVPAITPERLVAACRAAVSAANAAAPAEAIERALDAIHDGLDDALVAAFVVEHERLWSVAVRGYAMIPDGLPLDEGVIGRALRTGVPQLVADVRTDPDYADVSPGVVSELAIPLLGEGSTVGVVNIETFQRLPHGADEAVAKLGEALAVHVTRLRNARSVDLSSLARLFVYVSSLREPRAIAEVTVRSFGRVLPVDTAQLLLREEGGRLVETASWRASVEGPPPLSPEALETLRGLIDASAVFGLLDAGTIGMPELADAGIRSVVLIPLRANGEDLGLLAGTSRFAREFDSGPAEVAAVLAAHAAASLDAALALGRERTSALTDPLTGLFNRRGLEERLERELAAAQDAREPLSLVVLDCDDFKDVNDRAGHEFGDALLREIGDGLGRTSLRGGCAARLGGDEFVVMLPQTDTENAVLVAADLRRELASGLDDAGFPLHLSAGLSTYPFDGAGASQLLRAADQALYEAKANGKDRVVAFRDLIRRDGGALPATGTAVDARRSPPRPNASVLEDAMEAATAIWAEQTAAGVLDRLGKALTFVVGTIGAQMSVIQDGRVVDAAQHSLRDIDLGTATSYLIDDFPITRGVIESGVTRALSFLDDDLDPAEAFVLRELQMSCCLMLRLDVHGSPWGLVELYDMRLRRFSSDDQAVAEFLVDQAGRRLESLHDLAAVRRRLPLFRLPRSGV